MNKSKVVQAFKHSQWVANNQLIQEQQDIQMSKFVSKLHQQLGDSNVKQLVCDLYNILVATDEIRPDTFATDPPFIGYYQSPPEIYRYLKSNNDISILEYLKSRCNPFKNPIAVAAHKKTIIDCYCQCGSSYQLYKKRLSSKVIPLSHEEYFVALEMSIVENILLIEQNAKGRPCKRPKPLMAMVRVPHLRLLVRFEDWLQNDRIEIYLKLLRMSNGLSSVLIPPHEIDALYDSVVRMLEEKPAENPAIWSPRLIKAFCRLYLSHVTDRAVKKTIRQYLYDQFPDLSKAFTTMELDFQMVMIMEACVRRLIKLQTKYLMNSHERLSLTMEQIVEIGLSVDALNLRIGLIRGYLNQLSWTKLRSLVEDIKRYFKFTEK